MEPRGGVRGGLTLRVVVASVLLSLLIGGAFATLFGAINGMRHAAVLSRHSERVLAAANDLERLVVDLETGERGYAITQDEAFLAPWQNARTRFGPQAEELVRLSAAHHVGQAARARQIARDGQEYIVNFSDRAVRTARDDPAAARGIPLNEEGRRRVDRLRVEFREFGDFERGLAAQRDAKSTTAARRATVTALAGIGGSILLVTIFGTYLSRGVVRPVRRASLMADRLAHGDLTVRVPETGHAEVNTLERTFNTMAHSLEASRDELTLLVEQQAALRRAATLVAQGVASSEIYQAVASEVGRLLRARCMVVRRFEADEMATVVGIWSRPDFGPRPAVGSIASLDGESVGGIVRRTGRPAHLPITERTSGEIAEWARKVGLKHAAGSPVAVEGRLWGLLVGFWADEPMYADIEEHIRDFTALVATAVANSESRAELNASRARVVEAADAARRRIERDLHDGTQQRLVSLGLELRMVEADLPEEQARTRQRLSQSMRDLAGIVEDLREISRGIHPAILSKGGLISALKTLARRSSVPVELEVDLHRPLAERLEVAVYYIVSEALTNAAKHARASVVHVTLGTDENFARVSVTDDGRGGAELSGGSGLIGLRDRVDAIGGQIQIKSPAGGGTALTVRIPLEPPAS